MTTAILEICAQQKYPWRIQVKKYFQISKNSVCHQNTYIKANTKKYISGRRKMIPDGLSGMLEEMKSKENRKYIHDLNN